MMRTFIEYIIDIIIGCVFALNAFLVLSPLWNVIGIKVCCCVAMLIGWTWFIPILIHMNNQEKIEDLNKKLNELLNRTNKDEL